MTRKSYFLLLSCALFATLLHTGCGGDSSSGSGEGESASVSTENTEGTADTKQVSSQGNQELVGVWLGIAYIDVDKFNAKLEQVPDAETQNQMLRIAQSFQTTKLGVEFKTDLSYAMDMEIIATNGSMLRGESEGQWKIVSQEDDMFVVESTEQNAEGEMESKQTQYRMIDADHFAFIPPVDPSLLDCDPLIVFERQTLEEGGSTADTAQQPAILSGEDLR